MGVLSPGDPKHLEADLKQADIGCRPRHRGRQRRRGRDHAQRQRPARPDGHRAAAAGRHPRRRGRRPGGPRARRSRSSSRRRSCRARCGSGVANQRVVVRTLRLPQIEDRKELETAVRFQAQDHIPMPLEQAVLDWQVVAQRVGEGGKQMDVVVVAARREMVSALASRLRRAGLKPVGIDVAAFGMIRALAAELGPDRGRERASYEERAHRRRWALGRRRSRGRTSPRKLLLQPRRRHQPRRRARLAPACSPASPRSASRASPSASPSGAG